MVDGHCSRPDTSRFGRYALLDEIASGGMASVYLARLEGPEGFQRTVALKRPHPHLSRSADAVTMFLDEARMAARIRHVNVVPTLDVVDEGGQVALVMEYVEGESLSNLVHAAASADLDVPVGVAARIAFDVLEGLHAAHEVRGDDGELLGLVHRDVSPHNVLVGVDGLARVVDFGIAKADGRMYQTVESGVKGKLGYVAPEYLSCGQIDRRSDVYATAVILWELLAGRRLFMGRSEHELMSRVLTLVVPSVCEMRIETPFSLAAVVARALSRNPDSRYDDAQAMARALKNAVPLASNDEVGAWVKSLASESLAARSSVLARADQSLAAKARGGTPATLLSYPPPDASPVAGPAAMSASNPAPREHGRSPWFIVTLLASAVVVVLAWGFLWREAPGSSGPAGAASSPTVPAFPISPEPADGPLSSPATAEPQAKAPRVSPAPNAEPPTRAPAPNAEPPRASPLPAVGRARRSPPAAAKPRAAPAARPSCDPPYTYDNEGIRHFKPQCL